MNIESVLPTMSCSWKQFRKPHQGKAFIALTWHAIVMVIKGHIVTLIISRLCITVNPRLEVDFVLF